MQATTLQLPKRKVTSSGSTFITNVELDFGTNTPELNETLYQVRVNEGEALLKGVTPIKKIGALYECEIQDFERY